MALSLLALAPIKSEAATVSGHIDFSGSALSDPGLVVSVDPAPASFSLNIADGQSTAVKLFEIYTTESYLNADDFAPQSFNAEFTFDEPSASGTISGATGAFTALIFSGGYVTWGDPLVINLADGGLLTVQLFDATFGFGPGFSFGDARAEIYGKFSYTAGSNGGGDVSSVPLPAAFSMMAGVLALFGAMAWRRRRALA